jgi:hypothetical protein
MKITLQNWQVARRRILKAGIELAEYDSKDRLQTIITRDGQRFEFSQKVFEEFKKAGLLQRGIKLVEGVDP